MTDGPMGGGVTKVPPLASGSTFLRAVGVVELDSALIAQTPKENREAIVKDVAADCVPGIETQLREACDKVPYVG